MGSPLGNLALHRQLRIVVYVFYRLNQIAKAAQTPPHARESQMALSLLTAESPHEFDHAATGRYRTYGMARRIGRL